MTLPEPFDSIELPLHDRRLGKVRVSYAFGSGQRLFVTTDRLSAFDRIIARVPYKGQVSQPARGLVVRANRRHRAATISCRNARSEPHLSPVRAPLHSALRSIVRGHITGVTDTALWTAVRRRALATIYGHRAPRRAPPRTTVIPPAHRHAHHQGRSFGGSRRASHVRRRRNAGAR